MVEDRDASRWTVLERLDVALAARWSGSGVETGTEETVRRLGPIVPSGDDLRRWISGALALRGIRVTDDDIRQVLERTHGRFLPEHQEFKLIAGLGAVLDRLIERSEEGREPDGWFAVGLFRTLTEGIDRFRNNHLRRDVPWDAVLGVRYPDPEEIPGRIDGFHPEAAFGEDPAAFEGLHPVRRALRVLWRLARIAPFPDYNLAMSFAVGCSYLLSHGYPLLVLERGDRGVLERLIRSGAPKRATRFELRLLESVAGCRPAKGGGTVRGERDR